MAAWESAPVVAAGGSWKDAPLVGAATEAAPMGPLDSFKRGLSNFVGKDLLMGGLRGAAGIGATIMQPFQAALDPAGTNQAMREGIEGGVAATGADPSSLAFQAGKLGTEIAGTAGAGGVLAAPLKAAAPRLASSLASGGFTTGAPAAGNALSRAADLGIRTAGGAVTGGASAALIDTEAAGAGAAVGGALPGALKVAGMGGNALGKVLRGPEQAPEAAAAIQAARKAGYVIPPTQAKPTLGNRALEGFAGKITTAQNASAKNQAVTNAKAATAIGLPAETKITPEVLADVRSTAGRAYAEIGSTGVITPGPAYEAALDKIAQPFTLTAGAFPNAKASPVLELVDSLRSPAFASASAVEKIKQLRTAADDAFRTGNTDVARASKSAAKALEDAMEDHLTRLGEPEKLTAFRDARELIAKTYSIEKALNRETGSVDAKKLAAQLAKGKPLSGDLKDAGAFAARFPKAAQTPEGMGSLPGMSPLDWVAGSALSVGTMNPLAMLTVGARPLARGAALSGPVQNRLVQQPRRIGGNNALRALAYRSTPAIAADQ
jgi:hypothetical protein